MQLDWESTGPNSFVLFVGNLKTDIEVKYREGLVGTGWVLIGLEQFISSAQRRIGNSIQKRSSIESAKRHAEEVVKQFFEAAVGKELYVPGSWCCDRCNFVLMKRLLNSQTGEVGTDNSLKAEPCPNCGTTLRLEAWKERAERNYEAALSYVDEIRALREASDIPPLIREIDKWLEQQYGIRPLANDFPKILERLQKAKSRRTN
jgi:DNA repair exonuclease SbcCD ATPase subunit